jgi:hypothetical protein
MLGELGRHEAIGELSRDIILMEIAGLIEIDAVLDGWTRESARLFAIDTAMLACRQGQGQLADGEVRLVMEKLAEARRLVVDDRDSELEWVLTALEPHLNRPGAARAVWATVLNSLLPCPYRAAVATCRAALVASPARVDELSAIMRDRLRARLEEGALLGHSAVA